MFSIQTGVCLPAGFWQHLLQGEEEVFSQMEGALLPLRTQGPHSLQKPLEEPMNEGVSHNMDKDLMKMQETSEDWHDRN